MSSPRVDKKAADAHETGVGTQDNEDVAVGLHSEAHVWTRPTSFYRSVLFQMILFGALSLVGPALQDAITNLGGGGLSTPYLANLANALNYVMGCLTTLFGGPLINKFGIKWSCMIAAVCYPLTGSAYYTSARFGNNGYLLASQIIGGVGSGFLYVAETTAMLVYPPQDDRGLYLGIWSAMRNTGSVIGGAINFGTNHGDDSTGGIAWATYLVFVALECTGVIWALLLSSTQKVRRRDGGPVEMAESITWKQELILLGRMWLQKKTLLVAIPAFYSFFYGGVMGTYLSTHFSVRARALSSLIVPSIVIPLVIAYGRLLDTKSWSRNFRAWLAFALWVIPQIACFIWIGFNYGKFTLQPRAFDYETEPRAWAEAYVPYLIMFVTGYWTQLSLYWILGCLNTGMESSARTGGLFRAFETAGQAVSYGINSTDSLSALVPLGINCGVLVATIPCMVLLIRAVAQGGDEEEVEVVQVGGGKSVDRVELQH